VPPAWRAEVLARVHDMRGRALVAAQGQLSAQDQARVAAVGHLLDGAEAAAAKPGWWGRRFAAWWSGSTIDYAWDSVQRAELALIDVVPEAELYGTVAPLLRWMRQVLPEREAEAWREKLERWTSADRVQRDVLRQALGDVIAANRDWHSSLRAFRNVILCAATGLALLLVLLSGWHLANNSIVPLCPSGGTAACFGGSSSGKTVIEVELVGMLGGLLGSAFLLGKLRKPPARYNVLLPQIVLKAVTGAAAALVGVLFVQSGLVLSPPHQDRSAAVLLAYAFTFGFSQQLLTQLVDRQSRTLLAPPGKTAA